MDELKQISGVGAGKAMKFGAPFIELIKKYVEDNDIDRPIDMVIKTQANKSALKGFYHSKYRSPNWFGRYCRFKRHYL